MAQLAIIGMDNGGFAIAHESKLSIGQSDRYSFLRPGELADLARHLENGFYPFMSGVCKRWRIN